MCNQDESKYKMDILFAAEFNNTNVSLMYKSNAIYAPSIAINLYTNALLRKISGDNQSYISTTYEQISKVDKCYCYKSI